MHHYIVTGIIKQKGRRPYVKKMRIDALTPAYAFMQVHKHFGIFDNLVIRRVR